MINHIYLTLLVKISDVIPDSVKLIKPTSVNVFLKELATPGLFLFIFVFSIQLAI